MRFIMLPVLFSLAYIGFENRDKIADQYNAAYPSDPVKQAALQDCIARHPNFNRLDADDRHACYTGTWGRRPVALPASPSPYYAYSPSHLAGNDVRRQEANASYRPSIIPSAQAAPLVSGTVGPAVPVRRLDTATRRSVSAHHVPLPGKQRVTTAWN